MLAPVLLLTVGVMIQGVFWLQGATALQAAADFAAESLTEDVEPAMVEAAVMEYLRVVDPPLRAVTVEVREEIDRRVVIISGTVSGPVSLEISEGAEVFAEPVP